MAARVLRVGYIREHFAAPLLQFAKDDQGKTFTLVECPGGTGQIISRLKENEIDVAIALTDALISGIANGIDFYRLVGSYVTTPLNWAVITGKDSKYQSIDDLRGTTVGISRVGSGSQVMAAVMAMQQEWYSGPDSSTVEKFEFQVNNNIDGLIKSVNDGSTSAFMWEWFTTKPYVDKGLVRFIGSVPTPWPSWMVAAHSSPNRAPLKATREFLAILTTYVTKFNSPEARVSKNIEYIKANYGYPEEDIRAWMNTVEYPVDVGLVDPAVVVKTLSVLEQAGVVTRPKEGFEPERFVNGLISRIE